MPTTMRPVPSQAAEEGAEAGDAGGRGVAPGAGGQHGEEEVAAAEVVYHCRVYW
jgi:hypothetical protein